MKMILNHNGQNITLDENEQSMIHDFYVFHCTKDRMHDWMDENDIDITFKDDDAEITVVTRIIDIMNDYHVSEDDAISTVFEDDEYMKAYTIMTINDLAKKNYDYVSYRLTLKEWKDSDVNDETLRLEHSTFAGCFAITDGKIKPLDGDSYDLSEKVLWFEEWINEEEGIQSGLTIIVPANWL